MELNIFVELLDGSRKQIGGMTLFSWVCSADTPADSLKVRCLQQMEAEVVRIEVQSGGRRLFRGFCDRQKTSLLTGPDATPSFGDGRMQRC